MPKFRKKTLIEAYRFVGEYDNPNIRWNPDTASWEVFDFIHETWIKFKLYDWIATGPKGEQYPINREVFEQTYEEVNDLA